MPHVISDECIACGACESQCESSAIKEGEDKYTIIASVCTDCASCVEVCPVNAIFAP